MNDPVVSIVADIFVRLTKRLLGYLARNEWRDAIRSLASSFDVGRRGWLAWRNRENAIKLPCSSPGRI